MSMLNVGEYRHKIRIVRYQKDVDEGGFDNPEIETEICSPYAKVRTTSGYTLIASNSDFSKAYTNFTIRYLQKIVDAWEQTGRDLFIIYQGRRYHIDYLNNINEANIELEFQAKVVEH